MPLNRLVRLSTLIATAVILYRFSFKLPFFPPFLKWDASEVPVLVGALAYGPGVGVLLEVVKNLLHFLIKGGGNPVGLVANFASGTFLILGTTVVYSLGAHHRWRWLAAVAGAITMALAMIPLNIYFFLPAHGMQGAQVVDSAIKLFTPFNLVKAGLSGGLGLLFYERLSFLFQREGRGVAEPAER